MNEKDKIREELEGLSPLLSKIKEESGHPFRTPEGYFQGLPDDVLRRIRAEEGLVRRSGPAQLKERDGGIGAWLQWLLMPRQAAGLALALLLAVGGAYLFRTQGGAPDAPDALAGISEEEAKEYVSENIGEFGLELMLEASVVSAEDISEIEMLPEIGQEDLDIYLEDLIEDLSLEELEELL